MLRQELIEERSMTMAEVKEELAKIKKENEELNFRAGKCEEYLNDFVSLSLSKAKELWEKLQKLGISRLKDDQITKLVDLLPTSVEDAKVILQAAPVSISKKDMERIVSTVKEFV